MRRQRDARRSLADTWIPAVTASQGRRLLTTLSVAPTLEFQSGCRIAMCKPGAFGSDLGIRRRTAGFQEGTGVRQVRVADTDDGTVGVGMEKARGQAKRRLSLHEVRDPGRIQDGFEHQQQARVRRSAQLYQFILRLDAPWW